MSDNKESKFRITQVMLILRVAISCYLIYVVISLINSYMSGEGLPLLILIIVTIIFGCVGLGFGYFSIRDLIKGRYIGGKADVPKDSE